MSSVFHRGYVSFLIEFSAQKLAEMRNKPYANQYAVEEAMRLVMNQVEDADKVLVTFDCNMDKKLSETIRIYDMTLSALCRFRKTGGKIKLLMN